MGGGANTRKPRRSDGWTRKAQHDLAGQISDGFPVASAFVTPRRILEDEGLVRPRRARSAPRPDLRRERQLVSLLGMFGVLFIVVLWTVLCPIWRRLRRCKL